jgi:hypothetical protein
MYCTGTPVPGTQTAWEVFEESSSIALDRMITPLADFGGSAEKHVKNLLF